MNRQEILQRISQEYHDLNGTHYDTLARPPSALEFARLARIARPVVIKGMRMPAHTLWTDAYLARRMAGRRVAVAATPDGRADAVVRAGDGRLYFVEPHVEKMDMGAFLATLGAGEPRDGGDVFYLQSQNGNMYSSRSFAEDDDDGAADESEFAPLRQDVLKEIPWCSEAFDKHPDAVNLWIGDGRSVTSIHSDPYENIYTVIRGTKEFFLLPPTEGWCLQERAYPHARYTRSPSTGALALTPTPAAPPVRWAKRPGPALPRAAHPLRIALAAGDTLYLPAGWWHRVRQAGGTTIALNWWYDVEARGAGWVWLNFLRGAGEAVPDGNEEENS